MSKTTDKSPTSEADKRIAARREASAKNGALHVAHSIKHESV